MRIELNDHVGVSLNGERVDHNQWIVMCDEIHVGYLQKTEGAWLSCIVFMDEKTKAELTNAVSEKLGRPVGGTVLPVDPDFLEDKADDE